MTFELERQLLDVIGDAAQVVDETTGFRYFDARDLLGLRRRHRQPDRRRAARRGADRRRRRPRLRRRQLRGRPEVPARHGRLGRAVDRGAGGDHGPDQDRQRRDRRRRRAAQVPQVARDDRGRRRRRAGDPARQHALRAPGRRRVRHLLHRLLGPAVGHRADARADVRRRAARRLRPAAGLLDRDHRDDVLRARPRRCSRPWPSRRRTPPPRRRTAARRRPPATASSSLGIGSLRRQGGPALRRRSRGVAASSPAAGSGRCSRSGSAGGSPGARARPPRTGRPR